MIEQPVPVMAAFGDHASLAQLAGSGQHQSNGGLAGLAFGPQRLASFVGSVGHGQQPPGFGAWRDRRMAMGLPFTGPQFQPTQNQNAAFNAQNNSGYGGSGYSIQNAAEARGFPRSY